MDEDRRRRVNRVLTFRWVLVGLTGLLAAVILASGGWLVGGLLAAMTVARIAMLIGIERRRRAWRSRYGRTPADTTIDV